MAAEAVQAHPDPERVADASEVRAPGAERRPWSSLDGYLSPSERRAFTAPAPGLLALVALREWALIFATLWLWSEVQAWWLLPLCILFIGTRQHALINLVHEACHWNVSRDRRWNDRISDLLFATPVLLTTAGFRDGHLPHHTDLGRAAGDTEKRVWINIRGWRFAGLLARHLVGWTAVRAVFRYLFRSPASEGAATLSFAALCGVTHGAIFATCAALGIPFAYFYLWLYPLFSIGLLLVSLLAIAQHQPTRYARLGREALDVDFDPPLARSLRGGLFEGFVFATIGNVYHHEHHLLPSVPHTRLGRLHRLLRARGFYESRPAELERSFAGVLARLVAPGRAEPEVPRRPAAA